MWHQINCRPCAKFNSLLIKIEDKHVSTCLQFLWSYFRRFLHKQHFFAGSSYLCICVWYSLFMWKLGKGCELFLGTWYARYRIVIFYDLLFFDHQTTPSKIWSDNISQQFWNYIVQLYSAKIVSIYNYGELKIYNRKNCYEKQLIFAHVIEKSKDRRFDECWNILCKQHAVSYLHRN